MPLLEGLEPDDVKQLSNTALQDLGGNGTDDPSKLQTQTLQELSALHNTKQLKAQPIPVSGTEAAAKGYLQGATMNFADKLSGAVEAAKAAFKPGGESMGGAYERGKREAGYVTEGAQEQHPIAYGAGELGGGLAGAAALPVAPVAEGAGALAHGLAAARTGAVYGGLAGAGNAQGTPEDYAHNIIKGATTGAVTGGAIGGGAASLAEHAPSLDNIANKFATYAVAKGKRQYKELNARPGGQEDFGQSLRDLGLVKAGDDAHAIAYRASEMRDKLGSQIGDIVKGIDAQTGGQSVDTAQMARRMQSQINFGRTNPESNAVADSLQKDISRFQDFYADKPTISLQELGQYKKALADKYWADPADRSPDVVAGRQMAKQVGDLMEDKVSEVGSQLPGGKDLLNEYQNAKKQFSTVATADKFLQDRVSGMDSNRMFSPTDYFTGGAAALAHGGSGITEAATGGIAGFVHKLVRERGASTTSALAGKTSDVASKAADFLGTTADKVMSIPGLAQAGNLVQSERASLGKYAPLLSQAAERGVNSFIVTHATLYKNNPDYRQIIDQGGQKP